jgi:hypothetical protein
MRVSKKERGGKKGSGTGDGTRGAPRLLKVKWYAG